MDLSLGDKQAGLFMRNASSLSTESSEFEFDSCSFPELDNELPLSPKLQLYSPHYSPSYSTNGEIALMASTNPFPAQTDIHASKADYVEQQGFNDHLALAARIDHDSASNNDRKEKVNLKSLLHRRDLQQLSPLTNCHNRSSIFINQKGINKQVLAAKGSSPASASSTPAESPSSSPMDYHAGRSTNPSKFEDDQGHASPPDREGSHKKNRKWAFNLDFLRKGSSPRSHPSTKPYSLDDIKSISHTDHCSAAAAAEEARLGEYVYDRNNAADAAGDAIDLQFNQRKGHSVDAAPSFTGEAEINSHSNQSIHNFGVGSVAVITKLGSPRQSMSSDISSHVSDTPSRAGSEMINSASRSAPIRPAGSPPRSLHAGEGAFTPRRSPMSPHALHYEQQRARNEQVRRRTFLPYRQSLLSACFFPASASPAPPHSQQTVF